MVCCYGMAIMTQRTTFALDPDTVQRLKRLADRWAVSQAEVVRRSVAQAELGPAATPPDPATLLKELQAKGRGLVREKAESYLTQARADRAKWRGE